MGSIVMAKSNKDNGQPCWVPLWRWKGKEMWPASLVTACGELYSSRTQDKNVSPKPILPITPQRHCPSMLSKVLWASSDSSALSPTLSSWACKLRKSLQRFMAVDFWGMNPDWSGWMIEEMTLLSLKARTLAGILISLCKKEILVYKTRIQRVFTRFQYKHNIGPSHGYWQTLAFPG